MNFPKTKNEVADELRESFARGYSPVCFPVECEAFVDHAVRQFTRLHPECEFTHETKHGVIVVSFMPRSPAANPAYTKLVETMLRGEMRLGMPGVDARHFIEAERLLHAKIPEIKLSFKRLDTVWVTLVYEQESETITSYHREVEEEFSKTRAGMDPGPAREKHTVHDKLHKAFADGLSPVCFDPEGVSDLDSVLKSFRAANPDYDFDTKTVDGVTRVSFTRKTRAHSRVYDRLVEMMLRRDSLKFLENACLRDCNEAVREFSTNHPDFLVRARGQGSTVQIVRV